MTFVFVYIYITVKVALACQLFENFVYDAGAYSYHLIYKGLPAEAMHTLPSFPSLAGHSTLRADTEDIRCRSDLQLYGLN